jgi:hypothetical protein
MRRITLLSVPGLMLLLLIATPLNSWAQGHDSATGPSAGPTPFWSACFAQGLPVRSDRGIWKPHYLSGVVHVVPPNTGQDLETAFARYVAKEYNQGSNFGASCSIRPSATEAQDVIRRVANCTNGHCVETGWTH